MKPIWRGSLSFGLVSIKIKLYSAIQEHAIGFTLLCKKCHEPIAYERWCKNCKKEVAWSNVVKGLKQEDGSYFILTQEELKALKPHSTDTIDIVEFVASSQIQPIYLERHFYVAPEKASEKPFFLFRKALQDSAKVAIGTFVMRDKQYACVITPYENTFLLTTLNYSYEIRDTQGIPEFETKPVKFTAGELKLANQLIDQLTVKKFNLDQFKDTFAQQLKEAIKKGKKQGTKGKGQSKPILKKEKKPSESSLESSLRASLRAPSRSNVSVAYAKAKGAKSRK